MARANAVRRGQIQNAFSPGFRKLEQFARVIGDADSDVMKAAAGALKQAIKQQLSQRGRGTPSEAGQPPAKQTGKLYRSIGEAVVGGVRRVGTGHFIAPILEFGGVRRFKDGPVVVGTEGGTRKRRARKTGPVKENVLQPRPFMRPALEEAKPAMTHITAQTLQVKGRLLLQG